MAEACQTLLRALEDVVERWLAAHPDWLQPVPADRPANTVQEAPTLWIGPPPTHRNEPPPVDPKLMAAFGQRFDIAGRDERNRALGRAGGGLSCATNRPPCAGQGGRI